MYCINKHSTSFVYHNDIISDFNDSFSHEKIYRYATAFLYHNGDGVSFVEMRTQLRDTQYE